MGRTSRSYRVDLIDAQDPETMGEKKEKEKENITGCIFDVFKSYLKKISQ